MGMIERFNGIGIIDRKEEEMTNKKSAETIVKGIRAGDKHSASIMMTMIENSAPESEECLRLLRASARQSHVVGITGWPGVGKSTLISRIAHSFLKRDKQVGIIAVDPTSPISGGSFLGDRERMRAIDGDERLFIRSMATRGYPGGIAAATDAFIRIMEAMGKEVILVETVGVGQDQVSVTNVADTVVMTVIPGMGDYLQALKAGIMELGDIFVVNKADKTGVEEVVIDLKMILGMSERQDGWRPPIVKTVATEKRGIDELTARIEQHRDHITQSGNLLSKRMRAARLEIMETVKARFLHLINERIGFQEKLDLYAEEMLAGKADRHAIAERVFRETGIIDAKHRF
jgi:LAO/AO transport system kinase